MAIPPLDDDGFLPAGVHDCTLEELEHRFGCFVETDRRVRLFENLKSFVGRLQARHVGVAMVVDGSFVTAKPAPSFRVRAPSVDEKCTFGMELLESAKRALDAPVIVIATRSADPKASRTYLVQSIEVVVDEPAPNTTP